MEPASSLLFPYISRPNEHERLVAFLLDQRFFLPVAISTSLPGARGFGKTTLARAVCQDPRVRKAFSEGIYWVTLGQGLSPLDLVSRVQQLIFDLTGNRSVFEDLATAEAQLHELLHPRKTLLVIDEADNEEALRPFLHSGPGGACLLITHDDSRLPEGARRVSVDIMMPEESVMLLSSSLSLSAAPSSDASSPDFEIPQDGKGGEMALAEQAASKEAVASPEAVASDDAASSDEMPGGSIDGQEVELAEEAFSEAITEESEISPAPEEPGQNNLSEELEDEDDDGQVSAGVEEPPVGEAPGRQGSILIDSTRLAQIEKEVRVSSAPSPEAARLFEALADRLNEWPLLLSLINGLLRRCFESGDPECQSQVDILQKIHIMLDRQNLGSAWRIDDPVARQHALASVVAACLEPLDPASRERYLDLAVFPSSEDVPLAVAGVLWNLDAEQTRRECEQLGRYALIELEPAIGTFRMQNALHDCLIDQLRAGQLAALHNRLLEGYRRRSSGGWATGPDDGYYFQHLAGHLMAAGRRAELQSLLFDFEWLARFLNCADCLGGRRADMYSLLGDYELALSSALDNQSAQLRLVQDALRLSAPAMANDFKQLAPQLLGRLLPFDEPEIQGLVRKAANWHVDSWLRPLAACFTPPGSDEVRVLSGHTDWVTGVSILPDGQYAVSSSLDGSLRMWDLANGQTQRVIAVSQMNEEESEIVSVVTGTPRGTGTLGNTGQLVTIPRHEHPGGVSGVVITPDGQKAITAGWDGVLRIWNLVTGREERAIQAHNEAVGALAITPDGKHIISAADDRLIRIWDLASGEQQFELTGHADLVRSLAITPDGRTLVSGSWDYTLRLWDLESGALMQILTGHEGWVQALAVTPDGNHALSSSWDRTIRIWDLYTGETIRELTGFRAPVFAMSVAPDNHLLIAGAGDGSVSLWNLENGECLRTLTGHTGGVNALALTSSGRFAVSASDDRTLRIWDLVAVRGGEMWPGHTAPVHSLVALPDSGHAVTASWDGTLKVWEPAAGREVRTLSAHKSGVVALALAADGRRAISGSRDRMLILWDLDSGEEILSLPAHENPITAVAITPDASLAASGDDAGVIKVWNLATGDCLAEFHGETSIWACALTPDGKTVMASESGGKMYFLAIER